MALSLNYEDAFVWHNLVAFLLSLEHDLLVNKLSLQNMLLFITVIIVFVMAELPSYGLEGL